MSCHLVRGAQPGLGWLHLPPSAAPEGGDLPTGRRGARGLPQPQPASSARACCSRCNAHSACSAWAYRPRDGKCLLAKCSAEGAPCLERVGSPNTPIAGLAQRASALCCDRPDGNHWPASSGKADRGKQAEETSRRFALLILGHRNRLMFETVPAAVISPTVNAGYAVDVFGYLENSSMAKVSSPLTAFRIGYDHARPSPLRMRGGRRSAAGDPQETPLLRL